MGLTKRGRAILAAATLPVVFIGVQQQASAAVWWDTNGNAAGAGAGGTATGTWDGTTANFNTSSAGTNATVVYGADNNVRFAAGTDATGAYTVTVSGTRNVNPLGIEEGDITFTGGTLNFIQAAGATSLLVGITGGEANTTTTIDSLMTGTNGFRIARSTVAGTQIVILGNTGNTLTGGVAMNSGTTVRLGASGVIADSNIVGFNTTAAASTFDVNGMTETVATLQLQAGTTAPNVTLGSGTLTLASPGGEVFNGVITGTGGQLVKNGAGSFILTGANTYTGGTTIGAGVLQIGAGGTTGSLSSNAAASITNNGILRFNRSDATSQTIGGVISGSGSVEKLGANTIAFTNSGNTYNGGTTISGGLLQVDGDGSLGSGQLNLSGGTYNTSASRTVATPNAINLTANSAVTTTSAATSVIMDLSGTLGGSAGTLTFRNDGANGAGDTFSARLSGSGYNFSRPIVIDNGSFVGGSTELVGFNPTGTSQTLSGDVSGNGTLRRSAGVAGVAGETILTGNNTFAGATDVFRGILTLSSASGQALGGTASVTVDTDGRLVLGTSNQINDAASMTLTGGIFNVNSQDETLGTLDVNVISPLTSFIDFGSGTDSILSFANSSGVAWDATAVLEINNWSGVPNVGGGTEKLFFGTDATGLSGTQLAQIQFEIGANFYPATILSTGEVVALVPEPAAAGLALVAGVGLAMRRRRRA
jgi:autotransporter-associated beta strand protein